MYAIVRHGIHCEEGFVAFSNDIEVLKKMGNDKMQEYLSPFSELGIVKIPEDIWLGDEFPSIKIIYCCEDHKN